MGKETPLTDEQLADLERSLGLAEIQSVRSGVPYPLGATVRGAGVNFALFSRHAIGVRLDLFDRVDAGMPTRTIILDAARNKTGDIWPVWLEKLAPGQLYGFRGRDRMRRMPAIASISRLLVDPCATGDCGRSRTGFLNGGWYDPSHPNSDLAISEVDDAATA
jgi:glycogen operon protein